MFYSLCHQFPPWRKVILIVTLSFLLFHLVLALIPEITFYNPLFFACKHLLIYPITLGHGWWSWKKSSPSITLQSLYHKQKVINLECKPDFKMHRKCFKEQKDQRYQDKRGNGGGSTIHHWEMMAINNVDQHWPNKQAPILFHAYCFGEKLYWQEINLQVRLISDSKSQYLLCKERCLPLPLSGVIYQVPKSWLMICQAHSLCRISIGKASILSRVSPAFFPLPNPGTYPSDFLQEHFHSIGPRWNLQRPLRCKPTLRKRWTFVFPW